MKYFAAISICTFFIYACDDGSSKSPGVTDYVEEVEVGIDYEEYLEDHRASLTDWVNSIKRIAELDTFTSKSFYDKEDIEFCLKPVLNLNYGNARPNEDFNTIFISTYSAGGKELHEEMDEDFFVCDIYEAVNGLLEGEEEIQPHLPSRKNEHFSPSAVAYMKATHFIKYVFMVDVTYYYGGKVYEDSETFLPPSMSGNMLIYDLENDQLLETSYFNIPGFETFNFRTYTLGGTSTSTGLESKFKNRCLFYFPKEIRDIYMPKRQHQDEERELLTI